MSHVRKALKWLLILLSATVLVIAAAIPFAVPPTVSRIAESKLQEYGYPARVKMRMGYAWRKGPEIVGSLRLSLNGTPWLANAEFGAGLGEWHARVSVPERQFSEHETVIRRLLAQHQPKAISNLVFSGSVSLDASVERTRAIPVPVWSAMVPIRVTQAGMMTKDKPITVEGLSVTLGASGIANHLDISPMSVRAAKLAYDNLSATNFHASVRATERAILINDAETCFCGGKVSMYSLFLDPKRMNVGLTLFLDEIDAGEALSLFKGFQGDASGRLHGKVRVFIKEGGRSIRLSDAFLYSTPGEGGKLKMTDTDGVRDGLALAGLDDSTRGNVASALTDLDYAVLKLNLRRGSGKSATLGVQIEGTATRGDLTVPVNLNVNINGEIEQIINTGLHYSNMLKGKRK